jgi:hypothetical protein
MCAAAPAAEDDMKTIMRLLLVVLAVMTGGVTHAQSKTQAYPNDDEINLLIQQLDRAMVQYEQVVGQEVQVLGDSASAATDMTIVNAWKDIKGHCCPN